jgi:cobalt-zinc-cadmium efflux system protein
MRLLLALILNVSLVGALVVVGVTAHSLGVMAAGADYLADAAGIGIAMLAFPLSRRFPRVHSIAALVNGGWLLVLSALVAAAALARLISGTSAVHGMPVLIVSSIAMLVMIVVALILKGDLDESPSDVHENLSSRAVLLDTLADAGSAAGVASAGAIILVVHGFYWLDPAVALLISALVGFHAFRLLSDVRVALRQ